MSIAQKYTRHLSAIGSHGIWVSLFIPTLTGQTICTNTYSFYILLFKMQAVLFGDCVGDL